MHTDFLHIFSPYLVALVVAYIGGQFAKMVIEFAKTGKLTWREFFKSGHMPSTHAAGMFAVTTVIGFANGWGSAVFALAFAITMIVIYDATHVRRAVGEQGLVLRDIIDREYRDEKKLVNLTPEKDRVSRKLVKPYFSKGHTPAEVIVGSVIGIFLGFIVSLIML